MMQHGPPKHDTRKVRRGDRADLQLHAAHLRAKNAHLRESVGAEYRTAPAEQRTHTSSQEQRGAADRGIDDAAGYCARGGTSHRELLRRQAEQNEAALREHILAQYVDGTLLGLERRVVVQLLHDAPRRSLALTHSVHQALPQ